MVACGEGISAALHEDRDGMRTISAADEGRRAAGTGLPFSGRIMTPSSRSAGMQPITRES